MKVKRSLGSRIRGWFPQEPKITGASTKTALEINQQPLTYESSGTLSATKWQIAQAIFWSLLGINFLLRVNAQMEIPFLALLACIVMGVVLGSVLAGLITRTQLNILMEKTKIGVSLQTKLLVVAVFVIVIGLALSGIYNSIPLSLTSGFFDAVIPAGLAFLVVRCVLLLNFERKCQMRIMQSWAGWGMFVVSKNKEDKEVHR
jgi:hypothetical protein